ncbi:hypothetical protein DFR48_106277 [Ciceribacter lividus]|uniref:Uncharacterized protein n=1 Tax=Ciceribacter lividus TaxID=1197950 RepID=A0A6I7HNP8_9HYPH|nr:hypothetical protein [Ciceribacter lividus]RCW24154.1 hypothetical protein DFR48_106277 [Ciceribacter lividus]
MHDARFANHPLWSVGQRGTSRPARHTVINQEGEVVLAADHTHIVERRPKAA